MSISKGKPVSDADMVKWANATAQKGNSGSRAIRSFKDPSLTTGIFLLDVIEGIRSGIVDPNLVIPVDANGDYDDKRQNGMSLALCLAK
jgi:plastin-1